MKWISTALLVLTLCVSSHVRAETVEYEGTLYYIYRLDPKKEKLELFLGEGKGQANTFPKLEKRLNQKGRELKFGVNAGIYEKGFIPSGLHVSEGKTTTALNLKDFKKTSASQYTPNFYLKPNGVFYLLENGSAGVVESSMMTRLKFQSKIQVASQSGPLLVSGGKIHPAFTRNSHSTLYRNGVGVTEDGKTVIFACSDRNSSKGTTNLFRFAALFKEKLNCPNALYLDGVISYIYIKGVTPPIRKTNQFAGIFAVTQDRAKP